MPAASPGPERPDAHATAVPAAQAAPVHRVQLGTDGPTFEAPADATLLASALKVGIALESACRNGSCRACMLRLAKGRVRYLIEWPGMLAEEKAEGWILPCVACPETDLVLATSEDAA